MTVRSTKDIVLDQIQDLEIEAPRLKPEAGKVVYENRMKQLKKRMEQEQLDCMVIYADREHYSNFRYYAGFEPRFEEGLLVVHREKPNYVLLGNECLPLYKESPLPVSPLLCQVLSLPGQPLDQYQSMVESFRQAGIRPGMQVGVVGWKLLGRQQFCVPHYLVEALLAVADEGGSVWNATGLLINPADGTRIINDVHTIAQLEYGAAQASEQVKHMLKQLEPGKSEMELAGYMSANGQVMSCHPLLSSGQNTKRGLISPTDKKVSTGDEFCVSFGLEGGLSCRGGYAAYTEQDLAEAQRDYVEVLAKPYYAMVASWYEMIGIGVKGGTIYSLAEEIFPARTYGWVLNPGHLIGTEEWLSSPIYKNSGDIIRSGMLVQMDIIPSVEGYCSPNAEDGVCIADEGLRAELSTQYPDVYARMMKRRSYMTEVLGIRLKPEVLPMSNLAGCYRPWLLNRELAFRVRAADME